MILLYAVFPIDPDHIDEAKDQVSDLAKAVREVDGVVEYRPMIDPDDPNTIRFFEQYEDEAAVEAHTEVPEFGEFQAMLDDVLAGEPELHRFEGAEAVEVDL